MKIEKLLSDPGIIKIFQVEQGKTEKHKIFSMKSETNIHQTIK